MVEGNERLGAIAYELAGPMPEGFLEGMVRLTVQTAEVVVTKGKYGDFFEYYRRRQPMSVASELAWQLLPPLTFGTDRIVISGDLAPAYDVGGDSFDYGVDASAARIAVFDAMGHGLEAGMLASVAVAAYRNCRRRQMKLDETAAALDELISSRFGSERFVTAVLAELELESGCFRWIRAGHPAPLLLRGSKVVKTLWGDTGLPLGLGDPGRETEESLEPGDQLVFFTDGVTEARSPDGTFFGSERLADLLSRASAGGNPPPETLRRLVHSILDHQAGDLQDDATAVLVEWTGHAKESLEL
jgi:serine phosphatase RsbU (regulator of sigma subunit)